MRYLIKDYIGYLQVEKGLCSNTLKSYRCDLKILEKYGQRIGKEMPEFTRDDVGGWIREQSISGASPSAIARRISSLRGFYNYLLQDKLIGVSPISELSAPRTQQKLPHYLELDKIDALLSAPDLSTITGLRDRALIELLYATGLRVSELIHLRVKDISIDQAILICQGKGSKQRYVPLGKSALLFLKRYMKVRHNFLEGGDSDTLFLRKNHTRMTRQEIWTLLNRYAKQSRIERISPHVLRHTFASHLIQRGADSRSVQILLGHKDLSTTQIYTHMSRQHLMETVENLHPRGKQPAIKR
jgi:integrase/recombinase XerD